MIEGMFCVRLYSTSYKFENVYNEWLFEKLGDPGLENWFADRIYEHGTFVTRYAVYFRNSEDAVAFALRFKL